MEESKADDVLQWHGLDGDAAWKAPRCVARDSKKARPGYDSETASEFVDRPEVLDAKVDALCAMLRAAKHSCVYAGAGLSSSAGIGDYASIARGSVVKKEGSLNRLKATPTHGHRVLTALQRKGLLKQMIYQSHDGLPEKSGFKMSLLNNIHGSWFRVHGQPRNPVVLMDGELRRDLLDRLREWEAKTDLCLALGTSLCGMTADEVATTVGGRRVAGEEGIHGLVIVGLQRTKQDHLASLRIFGVLDDVLERVRAKLKLRIDKRTYAQPEWIK